MKAEELFYFMRKYPVNLLRYLPSFLAKDPTFKNLQDTLSWEHEQYRLKLVDIAKQFFLETSTWGLSDWETFLGITPAEGQSFELRKAVARQKLRGAETMTIAATIKLMENFMTSGFADVEELGDFELRLVLDNGVFAFKEMFQALLEYLPAHLEFSLKFNDHRDQDIFIGQVENVAGSEIIDNAALQRDHSQLFLTTALQDITSDEVNGDFAALYSNKNNLYVTTSIMDSSHEEIFAYEPPDDNFDEDLAKILWESWRRWKRNPLIKEYFHHFGDDEGGGDIDPDDPDEPEIFPLGNFLRLYFKFPYAKRYRYLTVYDPREDVTAQEINSVGYYAAANKAVVDKKGTPTSGIARALLITKTSEKIL